jgi:zinc transport system ATP-binding protein
MDEQNILNVENVAVHFGDQTILENINFHVAKGDVLAVIGPNGAGKSVLFRTLLGLIPYTGKITWNKNVRLGYVPQKAFIEHGFPLTVREFLSLKTKSEKEILEALASVGILTGQEHKNPEHETSHIKHHILNRRIGVLSGGEFQRVLIAWALIDHPNVLLFDEPTSGIDIGGEETIYNLLGELQKKQDLTIILISHDLNIVYKYANNVICVNKQQICFGEPHTVLDPKELAEIYGGKASFYNHQHAEHEHI